MPADSCRVTEGGLARARQSPDPRQKKRGLGCDGSFQWRPRATASHSPQMPLTPFRPALSVDAHTFIHRLTSCQPACRPSSLPTRPHTRVAPDRHPSPSSSTLARSTSNSISNESRCNILPLPSTSSLPFDPDAISLHPTTATTSLPFLSSTRRLHTVHHDRNRTPALWLIRNYHFAPITISSHRNSSLPPIARLSTLELTAACLSS